MKPGTRARALLVALAALVAGGLVVAVLLFAVGGGGRTAPPGTSPQKKGTPPPASLEDCPPPTVTVASARELQNALDAAAPGAVILLAPTVFEGNFRASTDGTAEHAITLCGTSESILDGGGVEDGYAFHLDQASHWRLAGFTVRNGQKGVMADGTVGSVIAGLTVSTIGDEAIHLRNFSTDNRLERNRIENTGLRKPKFGEGIYIGTAESNWCDITDCAPDESDRNVVIGNEISGTTAESVDIKEGTSGGTLKNNRFDGSSIVGADSWVDVKGNDWVIEGNVGTNSPLDGFQTHEIVDGWGTENVFRNNTATVNGPGFGFALTPERANVIECSNTATAAGEGSSNVPCSSD